VAGGGVNRRPLEIVINGRRLRTDVEPHVTLLRFLRDRVGATEVKYGCGEGVCGACTVLLDETVAGLGRDGELHPLQRALVERGAVQCGFCTPGVVLAALEAVRLDLAGDRAQLRRSLAGNLCRCTGYRTIVEAVEAYRDEEAAS
jgi:carbon-monoxide dehydrogenase small subunit